MQQAIIIRVTPEDYDTWFKEHSGQEEARLEYGITDGTFYRDDADPNVALVHLNVESLDRAMGWFKFRSVPGGEQTRQQGRAGALGRG